MPEQTPLQPVRKTMKQAVPLQPVEVNHGADIHLIPKGGCDPHGKPMLEQAPGRTYAPMVREAH